MRYCFLTIIIIISSCGTNQNKVESSVVDATAQSITSLCGEDVKFDTSKLKLGRAENLNVYNGVRFLKLGQLKKAYINCLTCNILGSSIDSCSLSYSINFLDKDWNVKTYFINDTLYRIELSNDDLSLSEIFDKLQIVLGKPNLHGVKTINVENSSETYTIYADDKRQLKPL